MIYIKYVLDKDKIFLIKGTRCFGIVLDRYIIFNDI